MWQSCVIIQSTMVAKLERVLKPSKEVPVKRVKKDSKEQTAEESKKEDDKAESKEEGSGSDDEVELPLPADLDNDTREKMQAIAKKKQKKQQKFFRREQIARGVLRQIIKMFARIGEDQVRSVCHTNCTDIGISGIVMSG